MGTWGGWRNGADPGKRSEGTEKRISRNQQSSGKSSSPYGPHDGRAPRPSGTGLTPLPHLLISRKQPMDRGVVGCGAQRRELVKAGNTCPDLSWGRCELPAGGGM